MQTTLRVDGANCALCLNELIDRLRALDGINSVNSSISQGCIAIDHDDLVEADLVDLIGTSLHGITMASNEIVSTNINPIISVLHCTHESAHRTPSVTAHAHGIETAHAHGIETVTDALNRLRADGYTTDFYATREGKLACRDCDQTMSPADVQVDLTIRFEGDTNPDDQDIVFAIECACACGCKGTYSAAYGPSTPPDDTAVLRQLARTPHPEQSQGEHAEHE